MACILYVFVCGGSKTVSRMTVKDESRIRIFDWKRKHSTIWYYLLILIPQHKMMRQEAGWSSLMCRCHQSVHAWERGWGNWCGTRIHGVTSSCISNLLKFQSLRQNLFDHSLTSASKQTWHVKCPSCGNVRTQLWFSFACGLESLPFLQQQRLWSVNSREWGFPGRSRLPGLFGTNCKLLGDSMGWESQLFGQA